MNFLLHFLLAYLVIESVLGNASSYFIFILVFSIIIDLDHIPYTLKTGKALLRKKFGSESRTRFHELYGLSLLSAGVCLFSVFFGVALMQIIALSLVLHYAADFLLGKTRPFYPFSKKEVFLDIWPDRFRIPLEIALTLALGAILWLSMIS